MSVPFHENDSLSFGIGQVVRTAQPALLESRIQPEHRSGCIDCDDGQWGFDIEQLGQKTKPTQHEAERA